jgi:hypothetical protein
MSEIAQSELSALQVGEKCGTACTMYQPEGNATHTRNNFQQAMGADLDIQETHGGPAVEPTPSADPFDVHEALRQIPAKTAISRLEIALRPLPFDVQPEWSLVVLDPAGFVSAGCHRSR